MIDGLFLKDLNKYAAFRSTTDFGARVQREMSRTVLVDNSPVSMLLQPDNSILVSSFYTDREDNALFKVGFCCEFHPLI